MSALVLQVLATQACASKLAFPMCLLQCLHCTNEGQRLKQHILSAEDTRNDKKYGHLAKLVYGDVECRLPKSTCRVTVVFAIVCACVRACVHDCLFVYICVHSLQRL